MQGTWTYGLSEVGVYLRYVECSRRILICVEQATVQWIFPYWLMALLVILALVATAILVACLVRIIGTLWTRVIVAYYLIRTTRASAWNETLQAQKGESQ